MYSNSGTDIKQRAGAGGVFALLVGILVVFSTGSAARAGELEYQICMRRVCENSNYVFCSSACLGELNGKPNNAPLPPIPTLWGAVAVDSVTLATGFAKGSISREDAERRALADCRRANGTATGCKVVAARHNSCIALATSRGGGGEDMWGNAWSDDGWVSRREAVKECRKGGGTRCAVVVSFCTG